MKNMNRPSSLAEMDRLIREIKKARSAIRFHRRRLRKSDDTSEREAATYEIFRAFCRIESAAGCLHADAGNSARKNSGILDQRRMA